MTDLRLIDRKQLARELGVSVRTISRWRRERKLPKPLIFDRNRPFWSVPQIAEWEKGRDTVGHLRPKTKKQL